MAKKGKKSALRWLLITVIGGIVLLSAIIAILRLRFNGPALADTIEIILNNDIRGRVEVDSVEWPLGSLSRAVTGGWIPVEIRGLKVYDDGGMQGGEVEDDKRELLLHIDRVTAEIDAHSLILGHHDFVIRDLTVPDGGYALLRQVEEPYPLHLYDTSIVSLASAFYSRLSLGFRAGLSASSAKIFDIRSYDIRDATVEIIYPGVHLIAENTDTTGFLHSDFSDPLRPKVYFSLSPVAERGVICIGEIESDRRLEKPYLSIEAARANGTLCTTDPSKAGETTDVEPRVVYEIPLTNIRIDRLTQLPVGWPHDPTAHDVRFRMAAATPDGARLNLDGGLLDYWLGYYGGDYDIQMTVDNGGPLMELVTNELTGGDDVHIEARVSGPAIGPKVELDIARLDIRLLDDDAETPLELYLERAKAGFDMVTEKGTLYDTVARGAGGSVHLDASFGINPFQFNLRAAIMDPIDLRSYVPPDVINALGSGRVARGHLGGRLEISGDGLTQKLAPLDLSLGDAHISGVLFAEDSRTLHAQDLLVRLGQTRLVTNGTINMEDGNLGLKIDFESEDLVKRLLPLHVPELARSASGHAWLRGTLEEPRAHAELELEGVNIIDTATANIDYYNQQLTLNKVESTGLGGRLAVSGSVQLGTHTRLSGISAAADRLDLARIPFFGGMVAGRLSGRATANGRVDRLDASASASFDDLAIAGDEYRFSKPIQFRIKPDGSMNAGFEVERLGGGSLSTEVAVDARGRLAGGIEMSALPLQQLGILGGVRSSPVGGMVSTSLSLGGTMDAPVAQGDVQWLQSWFDRSFLGDGSFRLEPIDSDKPGVTDTVRVSGTIAQGDVDLVADIHTTAPYDTTLRMDLRRVEVDRFAPELVALYGLRGWISGHFEVTTPLVAQPGRKPEVYALISEASLWIDNEDPLGRPTPIQIRNDLDTPIEIVYRDDQLLLKQPVTLIGPGGTEFELAGSMVGDALDFKLEGDVDLALLLPYVRGYVDSIEGRIQVALTLGGTLSEPLIDAYIDICDRNIRNRAVCVDVKRKGGDVIIRPNVQDTIIYVRRGGRITLDNRQATVAALSVVVEDPYTGSSGVLEIKGGIGLENFRPTRLSLLAYGELSGRLLMVAAPEVFSRAGGKAHIEFSLSGTASEPEPDIDLTFQAESPFSFVLRGLRREIRLTTGALSLNPDRLEIAGLGGSFDSEGTIRDVYGVVGLQDWQPTYVDLTASADSVTYRVPGHLDLVVDVNGLSVTTQGLGPPELLEQPKDDVEAALSLELGNVPRLLISGKVEVVDGRYVRNFNLIEDGLTPASSASSTGNGSSSAAGKPFYEDIPLLANARLDVSIETRGFYVQNNLADIQLTGGVNIGGVVRDPRIGGSIQVVQGEFKIPGARARFTRTDGTVAFDPNREIPAGSPILNLSSESDYRDPSGQEHLVTLSITGSLGFLNWDLFTSSGLNKGQTLAMLFSGRTPEELRQTLGDEAVGRDPNRIDPGTDQSASLADQWLKDLTGDFISLLIEDKLRNLSSFDIARLEIGTDSIGVHLEKEWGKRLHTQVDLEQTSREQVLVGTGEVPVTNTVSLEAKHINKQSEDELQEDRSDSRLRVVKRFIWF